MRIRNLSGLVLAAALAIAPSSFAHAQDAGQDMKGAGHATKDAAVDTGHATKKVTKKTYHGTKHVAKKTGHVTKDVAKDTGLDTKGVAKDAGHDTKVGAEKTGHGLHKLGDKVTGKPAPQQ